MAVDAYTSLVAQITDDARNGRCILFLGEARPCSSTCGLPVLEREGPPAPSKLSVRVGASASRTGCSKMQNHLLRGAARGQHAATLRKKIEIDSEDADLLSFCEPGSTLEDPSITEETSAASSSLRPRSSVSDGSRTGERNHHSDLAATVSERNDRELIFPGCSIPAVTRSRARARRTRPTSAPSSPRRRAVVGGLGHRAQRPGRCRALGQLPDLRTLRETDRRGKRAAGRCVAVGASSSAACRPGGRGSCPAYGTTRHASSNAARRA